MQIITTTFIQNVILGSHQLHEQLSIVEARMIESAIVSMLTESFCENEQTLKYLARLLSPMSYMDVINARRGKKICGYPLCYKSAAENSSDGFFIHSMYCNNYHSKCSLYLMRQLSQTPLHERRGVHLTSYINLEFDDIYSVSLLEELVGSEVPIDTVKSLITSFKDLEFDDTYKNEPLPLDVYFGQLTTDEETCIE
ncbi:BFH_collapsed_G0009280.mRNA.1.CDS.1 [Saccharomyces cerevisiae]|nr:Rtr2p [Saccharomyces cerevisiae YJM1273]AJV09015.1 Rtr2p [Saccharomyces cerevisiae YJM1434]AJV13817.1 Rtr2p [Saccharomyces cerevisiae YJM1463]CAD6610281.1 BJ4_G0046530.mRNA.1.CDS.1 [Saccharomyces cerevisiae]CAI4328710.1 AVI_1a_G0009240.mRNA.1.CDS.1 [Saccharomyces cerevisiae]